MINIMNSISQIRSDIACTTRACPPPSGWGKLTQTPSRRVLVLHLGQIDIPRHTLGCGTAQSTNGGGVGRGGRPS